MFVSSLAWASVASAHAGGLHPVPVVTAHCPGHPHGVATGPTLGTAPERSPACAALCAITDLAQINAQIIASVVIDGVKYAPPAPAQSLLPGAVHRRAADMPPGADPPLYLKTVRFLI